MWDNFYFLKATLLQTKCLVCPSLVPSSGPAPPEPLAEVLAALLTFLFTPSPLEAPCLFFYLHFPTIWWDHLLCLLGPGQAGHPQRQEKGAQQGNPTDCAACFLTSPITSPGRAFEGGRYCRGCLAWGPPTLRPRFKWFDLLTSPFLCLPP